MIEYHVRYKIGEDTYNDWLTEEGIKQMKEYMEKWKKYQRLKGIANNPINYAAGVNAIEELKSYPDADNFTQFLSRKKAREREEKK